jgi:DNA primase catalytic core
MNNDFETTKSHANLERYIGQYVDLKRSGALFVACCPFHTEDTPSFQVKGERWWCRGACGTSGDIFDFAERYHRIDKQEALIEVARWAGVTLAPLTHEQKAVQDTRERLYALMNHAAQFYTARLYDTDEALDYLCGTRGLTLGTIDHCRLGYAPDDWQRLYSHLLAIGYSDSDMLSVGVCARSDKSGRLYDVFRGRIVIPIRDLKGRIVAFTGRALEGQEPKYLHNTTTVIFEKSTVIHRIPLNQSTKAIEGRDTLIMVEGSFDPISAFNRAIEGIVSLLGKDMSETQLRVLAKTGAARLVFCLDNDEAGRKALSRLVAKHIHAAANLGVALYVMHAPHGKDPDDTFREHPDLWQGAVDAARPAVEVLIERECASLTNGTTADKIALVKRLMPILKGSNGLVTHDNLQLLSEALGYPVDVLEGWARTQITVLKGHAKPSPAPAAQPTVEHWLLYYILRHDDYLSSINQLFANASLEMPPQAVGTMFYGLNPSDFQDETLRALMVMINQARHDSYDTWNDATATRYCVEMALEMDEHRAAYERCLEVDNWSSAIGMPCEVSYDVFVMLAIETRVKRLRRESEAFKTHLDTWTCYIEAIGLLQSARETL